MRLFESDRSSSFPPKKDCDCDLRIKNCKNLIMIGQNGDVVRTGEPSEDVSMNHFAVKKPKKKE